MTDTSRQNPEYDGDQTMRDAMAVMTAFAQPDLDEDLVDQVLQIALDGTDHTHLVYNLGLISRMILSVAASGLGMTPDEVVRGFAAQMSQVIEETQEGESD